MRRSIGVFFAATLLAAAGSVVPALTEADSNASQQDQTTAPQQQGNQQDTHRAVLARVFVRRPKRVLRRTVRFTPPPRPNQAYVLGTVLPVEAAHTGLSASQYQTLRRRVECESHGQWWAVNGQYHGIGQFAWSTYLRGLKTLGSRRVEIHEIRFRRIHSKVYRVYSDGNTHTHRGRAVRQRIVVRRIGRIGTDYLNPWVQARIMSEAIRGISAVSSGEWSCR